MEWTKEDLEGLGETIGDLVHRIDALTIWVAIEHEQRSDRSGDVRKAMKLAQVQQLTLDELKEGMGPKMREILAKVGL